MQKETLKQRIARLSGLLEKYDEMVGKRRYRGFLPSSLRNHMAAYLDDRAHPRYDRRKQYEITRRLAAADKDYALAIRYLGRVESNRVDERLKGSIPRMMRFKDERRRQEIGEALKPILRLVADDFNRVLAKYPSVPWRAYIGFDYHRPAPDLESLRHKLSRRMKRRESK